MILAHPTCAAKALSKCPVIPGCPCFSLEQGGLLERKRERGEEKKSSPRESKERWSDGEEDRHRERERERRAMSYMITSCVTVHHNTDLSQRLRAVLI